jgi:hypothetical protein
MREFLVFVVCLAVVEVGGLLALAWQVSHCL